MEGFWKIVPGGVEAWWESMRGGGRGTKEGEEGGACAGIVGGGSGEVGVPMGPGTGVGHGVEEAEVRNLSENASEFSAASYSSRLWLWGWWKGNCG